MGFNEQTSAPKRQRSCIGCAVKDSKQKLYRIVRTADGAIDLDLTGRRAGRGAYVCSLPCLEKAYKQGKLSRSLKCSVEANLYQCVHDKLSAHVAESLTK